MKNINNYIYEDKYIGKGTFSKVYIGYKKNNNKEKFAIKKIYKKNDSKYEKYVNLEIEIMNKLNHENIIKLYDTIYTDKYTFLILELCDTNLSSYLNETQLNEKDTKYIIKQIVEAIKYIMDNNIVHRDLKPHNILINKKTKKIKLCDFGFAKKFKDTLLTETICGSPLYMAPELLNGQKYNIKSDIWSLGIIMYEIVMKNHPFKSNNINDLIYKINNNKPILHGSKCSNDCKELINSLLVVDYKNRLDWGDLFNNKWLFDLNDNLNDNLNDSNEFNSLEMSLNIPQCNELDIIFEMDYDNIKENNNEDFVFIHKPIEKNVFNTILENSNEIMNKIKKFI